jgi:hypothetical protein
MDALQQIKDHAAKCGKSIHALFKSANVAYSNWGRWDRGETEPSTRIVRKLLAVSVPTGKTAKLTKR